MNTLLCLCLIYANAPNRLDQYGGLIRKSVDSISWQRYTISKETTYFVEPRGTELGVDFLAAVLPEACKQVDPQENGLRDLVMLIANSEVVRNEQDQQLIKERFDLPFFPTVANTFQEEVSYTHSLLSSVHNLAKEKALREQLDKESENIKDRPWTRQDSEHYAQWIQRNLPYVDRIRGAVKKNFYLGKIPESSSDIFDLSRDLSGSLGAMRFAQYAEYLLGWYLSHDRFSEAQELVEIIQSLADRFEQCAMNDTEWITAMFFSAKSIRLECRLAGVSRIDPEKRLAWITKQRVIEFGHFSTRRRAQNTRYLCASSRNLRLFRDHLDFMRVSGCSLGLNDSSPSCDWIYENFLALLVDWNEVLKVHQAKFDVDVEEPESGDWKLVLKRSLELRSQFHAELRKGQIAAARRNLNLLIGVHSVDVPVFGSVSKPPYPQPNWDLPKLGYAMRIYRDEHGRYPTRFEDLLGKYLSEIPLDPVTKGPIRQTKKDGHIVLYTIAQERPNDGKILSSDRTLTLPK